MKPLILANLHSSGGRVGQRSRQERLRDQSAVEYFCDSGESRPGTLATRVIPGANARAAQHPFAHQPGLAACANGAKMLVYGTIWG
jgi:hypothetical protein